MGFDLFPQTVLPYIRIPKKFASSNPSTALLSQRVFFQGELPPRTRAASYPQRAFELGSVVSLMTALPLEY